MSFHVRVYDMAVNRIGMLPEFVKCTVQQEFCNQGSIAIDYPSTGLNSTYLHDGNDYFLVPVLDGVEDPNWYLLEDDADDTAKDGLKGYTLTVGGRGVLALFDDAEVYPGDWLPGQSLLNKSLTQGYANVTVGSIMLDLIYKAQLRGGLQNIGVSFTATTDSNGVPWPTQVVSGATVGTYTVSFDVGATYSTILSQFHDSGWADFKMTKQVLDMYVPNTYLGRNLTSTVLLHLGREVTSGPRNRSRRTQRNVLLVVGDEGAIVEQSVATTGRRREGYDGRGGITDVGTLTAIGTAEVATLQNPAEGITLTYASDVVGAPKPNTDYRIGDYIGYDQRRLSDNSDLSPQRVKTIARTFDPSGQADVSIELNDVIVEIEVALARRVEALTTGSTSNNRAPKKVKDTGRPKAPASVSVTSSAYVDANGITRAQATISWAAVTQNTDNSTMADFGNYYVVYTVHGEAAPRPMITAQNGPVQVSNLPPGGQIDVSVACTDFNGNVSAWTTANNWVLGSDTTAPPTPSTPTVIPYLGTLRVLWDGLGSAGQTIAPGLAAPQVALDFERVEVYMSLSNNFNLTDPGVTLVGNLIAAGAIVVTGLTVGQSYYFRFASVDRLGNRSTALSPTSIAAVPRQVGSADISPAALANSDHTGYFQADVAPGFTTGGVVIGDAGAYSGNGRRITASQTAGGVNYTGLKPGRYRASWVLKGASIPADPAPPTAPPARATVNVTGTAVTSDGALSLYTTDLSPGTPDTYSVRFTVTSAANSVDLPVAGLSALGAGTVELLQAYIEPVQELALIEVSDAQIGSCGIGKLVAGTITADMLLAATIKTSASTSTSRVTFDSTGIKAYNASTNTFTLSSADGSVTMTGGLFSGGIVTGAAVYGGTVVIGHMTGTPATTLDATQASIVMSYTLPGILAMYMAGAGTGAGGLQAYSVSGYGGIYMRAPNPASTSASPVTFQITTNSYFSFNSGSGVNVNLQGGVGTADMFIGSAGGATYLGSGTSATEMMGIPYMPNITNTASTPISGSNFFYMLYNNSNQKLVYTTAQSVDRIKDQVAPISVGESMEMLKMDAVTYRLKKHLLDEDHPDVEYFGLLASQGAKHAPRLTRYKTHRDGSKTAEGIVYELGWVLMLPAVRDINRRVAEVENLNIDKRLKALERKVAA